MYRKTFVSLSFTPDSFFILKLNSQKNQVTKFASFALPQGVIVSYRVRDKARLSQQIKAAWKKMGLSERSVGIVVPEFSTYTKSLSLPKLEIEELDEAVRWQMQEFLPSAESEVVMDWKIVNEEDNSYKILAAAILKDVLLGYVDAVGGAGLYPLVVETPSLSLSRVSDGDKVGRLVVYVGKSETILVVAAGHTILASSVVASGSAQEILRTAQRIFDHYKAIGIEKVSVGGLNLSKEFLSRLATQLGKKVFWITPKIDGLNPQQIQQYLIPISLQMKDPAEPASENTINLLSPSWIKQYSEKHKKFQFYTLTLVGSIIVWAVFLGVLIVYMLLNRQVAELRRKVAGGAVSELESITVEVDEINELSENVIEISKRYHLPQEVIEKIMSVRPGGISIANYRINLESGGVILVGKALDRSTLVNFRQRLEDIEEFSNVTIPVSNLVDNIDIDFELSLDYLPAKPIVKKAPKLKI